MIRRRVFSCAAFSRRGIIPVLMLLVLCMSASGCSKHEEKKGQAERGPIPVSTIAVAPKDVPVAVDYVAQTQSSRLVNIHARVTGFLDKRVYTEGSRVKEGQVLFMMDQKPFKVQLDQAKAAFAKSEAAMETARLNLARVQPLTKLNALSQKDLDDATGQFQTTWASVEQSRAQVESAKLNLSYTVITSPVDGLTSAAQQTDGTYISQTNSLLTTVAVMSPIWVNFSMSENDMQRVRNQVAKGLLRLPEGNKFKVEVILVDDSVFPHTGEITFADPSYNPQTGAFLLRATINNPDGILRPNQYVRARIKGSVRPNAILIPQRAIQQGPKGHFVWVVSKENKAEVRPVVVGEWYGSDWFVNEGLHGGDQVVVDGALMLRPGAPVVVSPPAGPTPAPKAEAPNTKTAAGGK
ncbi:MAG: efflux RND transporter periplasmic adaptor subunit [Desulfobacteraceae bacterium]|nr:efflux RND transporter periplasmic adaptor subunit [Desulfobacteraceae bacterium]